MPAFNKKVIVITELSNKKDKDFMQNSKSKTQALIDKSTYVPGLHPAADDTMTEINLAEGELITRDLKLAEAQALTVSFNKRRRTINDTMGSYASQIQDVLSDDIPKILELKFGVKDLVTPPIPEISVTNSIPVITSAETVIPLHHTVHFGNSMSDKVVVPEDATCIELYETFDVASAGDIRKMSHLGKAKHGKYVNHFDLADEGKTVYYMATYIAKKAGVETGVSVVFKAKVI